MAKQLTFIHAADLHIGAPFRGLRNLSDAWASRLNHAILEAYDRVVRAAIDNEVDFVIIAGDIYDTARASYGDYQAFFAGLRKLNDAGIPAYLITGNHDPYTSWSKDFVRFPANTTMFAADSASFALYERDGEPMCLLGGRSFYNQTWPEDKDISEGITRENAIAALQKQVLNPPQAAMSAASRRSKRKDAQGFDREDGLDEGSRGAHVQRDATDAWLRAIEQAPFAVGVLHTGLDQDFKAPVKPATLMNRGIDYWACGHVHKRQAWPSVDDPRVVFSGDIQGRDINEQGSRGCYLVTLRVGKRPALKFIPTASVVWQKIAVDVTGCESISDITDLIQRKMFAANGKAQCEEMCVRVTLTGETRLHEKLSEPRVISDMRAEINGRFPVFFVDALIDATKLPLNRQALAAERLFPAALMSVASEERDSTDELLEYLHAEFVNRGMEPPVRLRENIASYVSEAEDAALDSLMEQQ